MARPHDADFRAAQKGRFGRYLRRTRRPSPALVAAMVALVFALGDTAGAVVTAAVPLAERAFVADSAKKLNGLTAEPENLPGVGLKPAL